MKVRMIVYDNDKVLYKSSWMSAETLKIKEIKDFIKNMEGQIEYEYKCK